jgi:hypothetical protein
VYGQTYESPASANVRTPLSPDPLGPPGNKSKRPVREPHATDPTTATVAAVTKESRRNAQAIEDFVTTEA